MIEHDPIEINLEKARAFFERAEEVASTENFDYAIDLYLEGLRLSPDALEDGHSPLRRLALIRQGRGGKKPSVMEKMKHLKGKSPLDDMLNAEFLMAKDPDNLGHAEALLKAAVVGGYLRTAEWMAHIIFEANKVSDKPDRVKHEAFLQLKDCYIKMQMFTNAQAACEMALQLKPGDDALRDELRDLSAKMTMEKGKYGTGRSFRDSINGREAQERLQSQENVVKSADAKQQAVEQARKKIQDGYSTVTNILDMANALFELDTDQGRREAVKLLGNAFEQSKDFTFMKRLGEFRIKEIKDLLRRIEEQLRKESDNHMLQTQLQQTLHQYDEVELEHYRKCQENYPTDYRFKYDYGRCLIKFQEFDKAIPMLQDAQKDPRLKVAAMDKMGLCFLLKGWIEDAIDIFRQALEQCVNKDGLVAKDIRYNLARAYEEFGNVDEALLIYRKLAQTDFSYKDVGQRIDKLRKTSHN